MREELLRGGFVTEVVRVGDTVRRRPGRNAGFVHRLLEWLERVGWEGAPQFRGVDEQGREILSFLPGHVPWRVAEQRRARSDDSLAEVAGLVRQFHDLTAGTWLAAVRQYAGLGPQTQDTARACRQVRIICNAYGLPDRATVVDTILWWQDRCWRGMQAGADDDDPAMTRLHDSGAPQQVRQQHDWVARHHAELQAALR